MDATARVDSGLEPLLDGRSLTFPAGTVVALVGPPEAPTDSVLARAAAVRPTTYYSTKRAPDWAAETVAASADGSLDVRVEGVCHAPRAGPVHLRRETGQKPRYDRRETEAPKTAREAAEDRFDRLSARLFARGEESPDTLVVDDFTDYTDKPRRCLSLLDSIRTVTESITWLHVVYPSQAHPDAETVITAADAVCWIERTDNNEAQLAVPRRRAGAPVTDPVSLSF